MGNFITVKSVGIDTGWVTKEIARLTIRADVDLKRMADETVVVIQQTIEQNIRRTGSTGNLANSMYASKIPGGWGVGDIEYLNSNAKYWRHINFGSEAINANWEHAVPTGGFNPGGSAPTAGGGGQRWGVGSGNFSFTPGKPIPPMNYIEQTIARTNEIILTVLSESR